MPSRSVKVFQGIGVSRAIGLGLAFGSFALGQSYTFVSIADTRGPYTNFSSGVSINNKGRVAFVATRAGDKGVFSGLPTGVTPIALSSGPTDLKLGLLVPSISDSDTVVFAARFDNGRNGLFAGNGGELKTLADSAGPLAAFGANTAINSKDTVAFAATLDDGGVGVFTITKDGTLTKLADNTTADIHYELVGIAINESGDVAFADCCKDAESLLKWSKGTISTLFRATAGTYIDGPRLNDQGEAAFFVQGPDILHTSIFRLNSGGTSLVVDAQNVSPTVPFGLLGWYSLNNKGLVAFFAITNSFSLGPSGIYVGANPTKDKVITVGDPLFGSTLTRLSTSTNDYLTDFLNDSGQIAFYYELANGVEGIAVATPKAVEPGAPTLDIEGAANGATYQPGLVAGSWALVKGQNLSLTERIWQSSDFNRGDLLPTSLDGVEVKVNNVAAAVYFVSAGQVSFQVPTAAIGNANIQVVRNGVSTNALLTTIVNTAPGIFGYSAGGKVYPAALFAGTRIIVGDPAISGSIVRKARPGDRVELYVTGLKPSQAGNIAVAGPGFAGVTATLGSSPVTVEFAGLVGTGLFQVNVLIPQISDGDHVLKIEYDGKQSQPGVVVPVAAVQP